MSSILLSVLQGSCYRFRKMGYKWYLTQCNNRQCLSIKSKVSHITYYCDMIVRCDVVNYTIYQVDVHHGLRFILRRANK